MGDQTSVSEMTTVIEPETLESFRELEDSLLDNSDWQGLWELYSRHAADYADQGVELADLAEHLEAMADRIEDEREAALINIKVGDLYAQKLEESQEAKQAYRTAFVTDTTNTRSLEKARDIYRNEGNFELVLKLYELQQQVAPSDRVRADIFVQKAQVHRDLLGNEDVAQELIEDALALVPDHEAAGFYKESFADGESAEEAIEMRRSLARDARQEGDEESAAEWFWEAAVMERYREAGGRQREKELLRAVLDCDESRDSVRTRLVELGGNPGLAGGETSTDEEQQPEGGEESADEGDVGETQYGMPAAEPPADEQEGEKEEASKTQIGTAAAEPPADEQEAEQEEEAEEEASKTQIGTAAAKPPAEQEEKEEEEPVEPEEASKTQIGTAAAKPPEADEETVEESNEEASAEEAASEEGATIYERADIFEGSFEEAVEAWEEEKSNISAFSVIRDRLREEDRWEELADKLSDTLKYMRKQEGESELMGEIAQIYWKEIEDFDQAEYYYKRLKLLDNEHPDVAAFYEDYYAENEQWRRLFSHLKSREESVEEPEKRVRFVRRRAVIAEREMDSPEKAIDVWKNYLRDTDDPDARLELQRLYEEYGKWNGLVDFLKEEVRQLEEQGEETRPRRAELLGRMVDLYEDEIGHRVMALNTLQDLVELDPDNMGAFERLRDMLEESRRWNDLVNLLSDRAERLVDESKIDRAADCYIEVVDILEDELKHVSRAVDFLEQALEVAPDRQDVRRRLEEIYTSKRDYESLFELRKQEMQLYEGHERLQYLYDLLELVREKLHDSERTIPILEEIVELDRENLEALQELEEVYRREEEWGQLRDTLTDMARLQTDADERLASLEEAADLEEEHGDDAERAIALWERVLQEERAHEEALDQLTGLYLEEREYEKLEEMYAERGRHERLYELLETAAETVGDDAIAGRLYRRMSELADDELGELDKVIVSLEQLLEVTDETGRVARELAGRYREADEPERELEAMKVVLDEAEGTDDEVAILERLSRLEEACERPSDALNWQLEAIQLDPSRIEALDRAEQLARQAEAFVTFVELVETISGELEEEQLEEAYWRRLARIESQELDRVDDAIDHYGRLLERDEEDLEVLEALADLYERSEHYESLVKTLQRIVDIRTERGHDRGDLVETLSRIAEVHWKYRDDQEAARESFDEILSIDPDCLPAIRGMKRLHEHREEWVDVLDSLQRELGLLATDREERRLEVQFELAEVYRRRQDEPGEALHYYREILDIDPEHEEAIEALQALLDEADQARSAAVVLEPLLREAGRIEELTEALEARLAVADDDYERQDIYEELIDLYRNRLSDPERAFELAEEQFGIDPEREEVWGKIVSLAGELGRWEEVEALFAAEAPETPEEATDIRRQLLGRVAEIRRERLGDIEGATEALERLYEWEPKDDEIARELEELYRQLERHDPLVEILEDRARMAPDDEERLEYRWEAAVLYDDVIEDAEGAIDAYRGVLELEPSHTDAMHALEGLYRDREHWFELEDLYVDQIERSFDPEERRKLRLRLARLRADQLEDYSGAEEILSDLLADDPDDAEAVEALEELEVQLIKASEDHFPLRLRISQSLEPIYRELRDWEQLVDALTVQLRGAQGELERLDLLDELADLNIGHLGRREQGFSLIGQAVELDPDDADRREKLENLGRQLEQMEEVVETLDAAAMAADSFSAGPINKRIGELCERELDRTDQAIDAYEQVLDYDETDEEALRSLEDLYEQTEQVEPLVDNLRHQSRYADPERRGELLERIGQLERDVLGRPQEAVDAYVELLEVEPESTLALDQLESLYRQQDNWIDVAEMLRRKADVVADPDEKRQTLLNLAEIYDEELHDPDEAIAVYRRVTEIDSTSTVALDALERLFEQTDRWADVADVLRQRLVTEEADELERRTEIELKLADILREELYETEEAIELYRGVMGRQLEAPRERAVGALEELADEPAYAEMVADDLKAHYRDEGKWESLVDLLGERRDQVGTPAERAELNHEMARVYREQLDEPAEAIDALAEAWTLQPDEETYQDELVSLAEAQEAWARLAEVYRSVIPEIHEPDRRIQLHMSLAELEEERLDDVLEAEEHYREVLNLEESHEQAYDALDSLLVAEERWLDLAELLERKFEVFSSHDPDKARDMLLRMGFIQENKVDDEYAAADTFERVLELDPTQEHALKELTRLYRQQNRWEDLAEHLQRQLEAVADPERVVELSFQLAETKRGELYQHDEAIELYERILDLEIGHDPTVEALEEILQEDSGLVGRVAPLLERAYRFRESWEELLEILIERADLVDEPVDARSFLEQAAEIAEDRLSDPPKAFEIVERLFRQDPTSRETRREAKRLAEASDNWALLIDAYDDAMQEAVPPGDAGRADLLVEQGALLEGRVGDLEQARRVLGEALIEQQGHGGAIDGLERVLQKIGDPVALSDFYRERAAEEMEVEASKEWLEKLARHTEIVQFDLEGAIEAYYDILDYDPDDEHAATALQRLLSYQGRWHDLADLLRDRVEASEEVSRQLDFRFRLAQVLEGELDEIDEAVDVYREILDVEPKHRNTLRAIEGLRRDLAIREGSWRQYRLMIINELLDRYEPETDWRRIVDLLAERRELIEDPRSRADLLVREADLIEEGAADAVEKVPALSKLAQAYCLSPSDETYWDRFEQLADELDVWARVPAVLLEPLRQSHDPEHQESILVALGDVYRDRLNDKSSAVTAYQQALAVFGGGESLDRLESLLTDMEMWGPLVDVLERKAESVVDPDERLRLVQRLGRLYDEILEEPHRAIPHYEELREEEPEEADHYDALESIYERTGAYDELEDLLRTRLDFIDEPDGRREILARLATIQDEYLDRPEAALETFRSLHEIDPDDVDVIEALARLYERTNRWPELLEILDEKRDFADSLEAVNRIDFRRGQIQLEKLGDPVEALESFVGVLERDESFEPARDAVVELAGRRETGERAGEFLQSLYRREKDWQALQELYEEQLEMVEDPDRRGEIYMELANLHEDELNNGHMAFAMLGRALREMPDKVYLRRELDRLSAKLDNPEELLGLYEDTIETAVDDPDVMRDLHMRVGEMAASDAFGEVEDGIHHARKVLEIDEFDEEALDLLDRLYQQQRDWESLVDILHRRLELAPPDVINDVRFRLGYLYEVMFEENEEAFDFYRDVILDEPDHGGAIEGLERLVEESELQREVADLLEDCYRDSEQYSRLVQLYQLLLESVDDPMERARLNTEIAELQIDKLESPEVGYAFLGRALRADPHDESVQERLESLARELERYGAIVALYEDLLDELTDPLRIVEFAESAAVWAADELDNSEQAAGFYQVILDIEPEHEAALDGLETLARQLDNTEQLADVLKKKADIIFEPDEQREVLLELAEVGTQLERYEEAADAYRQALLLDESDTEVMQQLVGLYEVTEQYEELVGVLDRLTNYEKEPDQLVRLNMQIGRYCHYFLGENERAIRAYQQVLNHEAMNERALEELEELYDEAERWNELQETLEKLMELARQAEDTDEIARLSVRLGELSYERFGEVDPAVEWFNRALEIEKGHPAVIEALEEIYRQEQQWDELMALLNDQLTQLDSEAKKSDILTDMARINLEYMDEVDLAEDYLNEAFQLNPDSQSALELRGQIFARRGNWRGLLDVKAQQLERLESEEERVAMHLERADILVDRLDAPGEAVDVMQEILAIDPTHEEALQRSRSLYEQTGNLHGVYGLLDRRVEHAEDEDTEIDYLMEMAQLADEELETPQLVVDALERAYELRPEDLDIAEPLIDAYLEAGRVEDAEPILEELIARLEEEGKTDEAVRFQHQRGKLAEEKGDLEAAQQAYEAVFKLNDTYIPNLLSLGKLAYEREDWEKAKNTFQKLLLHQMKLESDDQKVDVYYYLGLIRKRTGDDRRAKDMFNRALSINSKHEPSREELESL